MAMELPEPLKAGRKTKRIPKVAEALIEALQLGCTRHAACAVAGICEETFYVWMREDSEFSESIIQAENQAEAGFTKVIQAAAAAGDWKAAESWLKRRRRKDWCEMVKQEVTGADGGALVIRIVEENA